MSQLQTDINLPSINSIDGFVTDGSMTTVMYSVENELDSIGNAVGNIHGTGDFQYDERKLINSLASSVGSELEDPALPYGIDLNNVVETHTLSGAKETALGLIIDTESSVTIEGFDNLNVSSGMYTVSTDPYNMSDTECFIDGRLIFFKKPPYSFTIQYTGTYPTSPFLNKNGYLPNVIPNPKSEGFVRPNLSLSSGRVAVDIVTANAVKTTNTYQDQYDIGFADYILPFVDGSGVTPCPKAYISAYKLNTISGKYDKLQVDNIYIISNTRFELDTDAEIDLDNDTIIISIANMSIKEWLIVALRELQNHKHDGSDMSSPLNHSDLAGLVPRSLNENINYAKSQIPNNDHPQYLNREGYSEDDNGTYRNAMLGDLFIASVNPDNLFNNIIERSNQIVFGATGGSGHSLYREAQVGGDVLTVASQSNGIRISYEYNNQKYAIAIQANDGNHEIASKVDTNDLLVHSNSGNTVFGKYDSGLETYILESIEVDNVNTNLISIGPITIGRQGDSIEISSTEPTSLLNTSMIVGIRGNSISKGLVFSDGVNTYAKIYDCAEDGTASTSIDNHLVIASGSDVYLTKNTTTSTTGVSTDERATLYAGDTHFYTVGANKTLGTKKNGIQFGLDHSIYLTNSGYSYDSGIMVVEATNKVMIVKPSLDINPDNAIYGDLEVGDIRAIGEISGAIRSNSIVATALTVDNGMTTVSGSTATFNGNVVFNESITFNDDVTIGVLTINNLITIEQQLNAASASINILSSEVSATLKGQVVISEHASNPSSLTVNVVSDFNEQANFKDKVNVSNELTVTSNAIINSIEAQNVQVDNATIASATITTLNIDTLNCQNLSAQTSIETQGTLKAYGETRLGFDGSDTIVHGDMSMVPGNTFDVALCNIKNVSMPEYSYDFNSDVPVPIDAEFAKDAVNREYVINLVTNIASTRMLRLMYPVGTIYGNAINGLNPGLMTGPFGQFAFGEWEPYAVGRVIVGQGTYEEVAARNGKDPEVRTFILNQADTGEYTHLQSIPEMPEHQHEYSMGRPGNIGSRSKSIYPIAVPTQLETSIVGESIPMNNMQPYTVAALWRRIG